MKGSHLALCMLLGFSANANAAGDPVAGKEKSAMCQGCHGEDGNSFNPEWPSLAGQVPSYLTKQMRDFQSGARKDDTMGGMVEGLSEEDIADIVAYFSSQKAKAEEGELNSKGRKLYVGGNRYTNVPSCAGCHGPNAVGNDPAGFPRLAGQKAGYISKALHDFRTEARTNDVNGMMQGVAAKMSDKDIAAVAEYLSRLDK
ncbi:MAG TPA: cytochrome c4 [Gammaproteobacteria bacterium]|nr:cytochrome c4 [Gammaproteobacteria bacterium]